MFANREEAGRRLASRLLPYKDASPVVLALPRGGVPVGFEVAMRLDCPLDLVLVRKIGVPWQPELALAAVTDGAEPFVELNRDLIRALAIPPEYLEQEKLRELQEIERRRALYLGRRARVPIDGRVAIVVDDGIATGATMRAALRAVRRGRPRQLVLAVPVAPPDTIEALRHEVDDLLCLLTPRQFGAIGQFYGDFHQLEDSEVTALLDRAPREPPAATPPAAPVEAVA